MILEEIEGNVNITYAGKTLSVGDFAEDYSKGVFVVGSGKAIFRVDSSCTFEVKGIEAETAPAPAPVEIQLTAESTVKAVEAPVKVATKAPAAE